MATVERLSVAAPGLPRLSQAGGLPAIGGTDGGGRGSNRAPPPTRPAGSRASAAATASANAAAVGASNSGINPSGGGPSGARGTGLVGMSNLGNTCYLNASVQCLSHTMPLSEYFLHQRWKKDVNRRNPLGSQGELASSYGALIEQLWTADEKFIAPRAFKATIAERESMFAGASQHDSQELLSYLLDGLHEDLNRGECVPKVRGERPRDPTSPAKTARKGAPEAELSDEEAAAKAWRAHLRRNKSIVVDLFQGQLRSCVRCDKCKHGSAVFDPFMYLSVPVGGEGEAGGAMGARGAVGALGEAGSESASAATSLQDCIRQFCREEVLSSDDSWLCEKCNQYSKATKTIVPYKLPPVLIVHLKRFRQDRLGRHVKDARLVTFPTHGLSVGACVSAAQAGRSGGGGSSSCAAGGAAAEQAGYDLFAVCNHHGSLRSGHYTSFVRSSVDREWYLMDDSVCTRASAKDAQTSNAYVLFYVRSGIVGGDGAGRRPVAMPRAGRTSPLSQAHTKASTAAAASFNGSSDAATVSLAAADSAVAELRAPKRLSGTWKPIKRQSLGKEDFGAQLAQVNAGAAGRSLQVQQQQQLLQAQVLAQQQQQQQQQHPVMVGEWQTCYDAQGRTYYYNTRTHATEWELPSGAGAAAAASPRRPQHRHAGQVSPLAAKRHGAGAVPAKGALASTGAAILNGGGAPAQRYEMSLPGVGGALQGALPLQGARGQRTRPPPPLRPVPAAAAPVVAAVAGDASAAQQPGSREHWKLSKAGRVQSQSDPHLLQKQQRAQAQQQQQQQQQEIGAWRKIMDEQSGQPYFYNASTGEKQWEDPAAAAAAATAAPIATTATAPAAAVVRPGRRAKGPRVPLHIDTADPNWDQQNAAAAHVLHTDGTLGSAGKVSDWQEHVDAVSKVSTTELRRCDAPRNSPGATHQPTNGRPAMSLPLRASTRTGTMSRRATASGNARSLLTRATLSANAVASAVLARLRSNRPRRTVRRPCGSSSKRCPLQVSTHLRCSDSSCEQQQVAASSAHNMLSS